MNILDTKRIIALAAIALLAGCINAEYAKGSPDSIWGTTSGKNIDIISKNNTSRLWYKGHAELELEAINKAEQRRSDYDASMIPKGGELLVKISALSAGAANTEFWEVIIEDMNGKEIQRRKGRPSVPSYSVSDYMTTWNNTMIVHIREPIAIPFKVFVYDEISNKTNEFIVKSE